MANYVFRLPDVGEGIAEAEIVAWHVKVGDTVKEDAPLVDVMTDKATVEIGAPVAGKIVQRKGVEGQMSRVGDELVVIETDAATAAGERKRDRASTGNGGNGAQPGAVQPQATPAKLQPAPAAETGTAPPQPAPTSPAKPAPAPAARPEPVRAPPGPRTGGVLASPAVRQRAASLGVDLATIRGSGDGGRIEHADLDAVLSRTRGPGPMRERTPARGEAAGDAIEEVPVIGLRRQIAIAMQESKRHI